MKKSRRMRKRTIGVVLGAMTIVTTGAFAAAGGCGAGKCGANMAEKMQGKCGGMMEKREEAPSQKEALRQGMKGKCAATMKKQKKKMEGKCGGSMQKEKMMKKGMEGKCGGSMM